MAKRKSNDLRKMSTPELMNQGARLLVQIAEGNRQLEETVRGLAIALGVPEERLPKVPPTKNHFSTEEERKRIEDYVATGR